MTELLSPRDVLKCWGTLATATMDGYFTFVREVLADSRDTLEANELFIRRKNFEQLLKPGVPVKDEEGHFIPNRWVAYTPPVVPTIAAEGVGMTEVEPTVLGPNGYPAPGTYYFDVIADPGAILLTKFKLVVE